MYAAGHLPSHPIPWPTVARWCARATGVVLIAEWVVIAIAELFHPDFYVSPGMYSQGAALALVFAGYALGWRWEWLGGILAIAGTVAFFAAYAFVVGASPPPGIAALLFAVPGVLYLEAWRRERHGAVR
jgi:hypothetical protein